MRSSKRCVMIFGGDYVTWDIGAVEASGSSNFRHSGTQADSEEEVVEIVTDPSSLISNLKVFFNNKDLSDIILRVGESEFHAHTFVLSISSDVFRAIIHHSESQTSRTEDGDQTNSDIKILELQENEECQRVFGNFLRFLYSGHLALQPSSAIGILCLADKYNILAMRRLAVEYMEKRSRSPYFCNALSWYPWTKLLNLETLTRICFKTICWNFECIIRLPDWLNLDRSFLEDVLGSSELLITDEYELYQAVKRWLMQPSRAEELESNVLKMLPYIRFPMMSVDQLYRIEQKDDFSCSARGAELVSSMLSLAYRFRALCPSQRDLRVTFNAARYTPRDYTSLAVDNLRVGNTLRFGFQVDVRMYAGAVPSANRDAEWKLTYRKNGTNWNLHVYCHESALIGNEAHFEITVVIYGDDEQIIDVVRAPPRTCVRGPRQQYSFDLGSHTDDAKMLLVLLKPLPCLQSTPEQQAPAEEPTDRKSTYHNDLMIALS